MEGSFRISGVFEPQAVAGEALPPPAPLPTQDSCGDFRARQIEPSTSARSLHRREMFMTPRASELHRVYLQLLCFFSLRQNRIQRYCFLPPFPLSLMHKCKQNKTKQNKPRTVVGGEGSGGEEVKVILIFKNLSWLGRKKRGGCGSPVRCNEIACWKIVGRVCLSVPSWEESLVDGEAAAGQVHASCL